MYNAINKMALGEMTAEEAFEDMNAKITELVEQDKKNEKKILPYLLLAPMILIMGVLVFYPIAATFSYSPKNGS